MHITSGVNQKESCVKATECISHQESIIRKVGLKVRIANIVVRFYKIIGIDISSIWGSGMFTSSGDDCMVSCFNRLNKGYIMGRFSEGKLF